MHSRRKVLLAATTAGLVSALATLSPFHSAQAGASPFPTFHLGGTDDPNLADSRADFAIVGRSIYAGFLLDSGNQFTTVSGRGTLNSTGFNRLPVKSVFGIRTTGSVSGTADQGNITGTYSVRGFAPAGFASSLIARLPGLDGLAGTYRSAPGSTTDNVVMTLRGNTINLAGQINRFGRTMFRTTGFWSAFNNLDPENFPGFVAQIGVVATKVTVPRGVMSNAPVNLPQPLFAAIDPGNVRHIQVLLGTDAQGNFVVVDLFRD